MQTQTVTCMQTQNGVRGPVVASACTGTQPASQRACNTVACAGGQWVYGAFSECSKTVSGESYKRFGAVSVAHCTCALTPAHNHVDYFMLTI